MGFDSGTDTAGGGKETPGQTRVPRDLRGAEEETARRGAAHGSPGGQAPCGHFLKLGLGLRLRLGQPWLHRSLILGQLTSSR